MSEMPLSADPQGYLENLMRAGQDAMKRPPCLCPDDAEPRRGRGPDEAVDRSVRGAAADQTDEYLSSGRPPFPFALIADLQREYLKQIWRAFGTRCSFRHFSGGTHVGVALTKGDKRFKDASWREQPYYDLLKQTYLLRFSVDVNRNSKGVPRGAQIRFELL